MLHLKDQYLLVAEVLRRRDGTVAAIDLGTDGLSIGRVIIEAGADAADPDQNHSTVALGYRTIAQTLSSAQSQLTSTGNA